jgi:23S rRNA pseudouridine1911/1915/1917 synthase
MSDSVQSFVITRDQDGATLSALLRALVPGQTWRQARRIVETRRIRIGDELCLDPARRVHEGEVVQLSARPAAKPRQRESVVVRYIDHHLVVVEKPSGISTVRHPLERSWSVKRKELSPTLEDIVPGLIALEEGRRSKGTLPRLRVVQRLDKNTSGLVVFARSVLAERGLGKQFHAHTVVRRYLAVVPGAVQERRIASRLIRDRGDGRRGSTAYSGQGKEAVTHVAVEEKLPGYTLLSCRLETGRTHQIRIHLAELGHPVCGETVYNRRADGSVMPDDSGDSRLALHAVELGFVHPATNEQLHFTMPLPEDLQLFLSRLRDKGRKT